MNAIILLITSICLTVTPSKVEFDSWFAEPIISSLGLYSYYTDLCNASEKDIDEPLVYIWKIVSTSGFIRLVLSVAILCAYLIWFCCAIFKNNKLHRFMNMLWMCSVLFIIVSIVRLFVFEWREFSLSLLLLIVSLSMMIYSFIKESIAQRVK